MAECFFDSSALVKAYIAETGTDWVRAILNDPQHRITISALAEVEVTSALTRRFKEGDLTQIELDQACDELGQDCNLFVGQCDKSNSPGCRRSRSQPVSPSV